MFLYMSKSGISVGSTWNQFRFYSRSGKFPNSLLHLVRCFLYINHSFKNKRTLVKVVKMIFSGFKPWSSRKQTRWVKTLVLPEPGPARIWRIEFGGVCTASAWAVLSSIVLCLSFLALISRKEGRVVDVCYCFRWNLSREARVAQIRVLSRKSSSLSYLFYVNIYSNNLF